MHKFLITAAIRAQFVPKEYKTLDLSARSCILNQLELEKEIGQYFFVRIIQLDENRNHVLVFYNSIIIIDVNAVNLAAAFIFGSPLDIVAIIISILFAADRAHDVLTVISVGEQREFFGRSDSQHVCELLLRTLRAV